MKQMKTLKHWQRNLAHLHSGTSAGVQQRHDLFHCRITATCNSPGRFIHNRPCGLLPFYTESTVSQAETLGSINAHKSFHICKSWTVWIVSYSLWSILYTKISASLNVSWIKDSLIIQRGARNTDMVPGYQESSNWICHLVKCVIKILRKVPLCGDLTSTSFTHGKRFLLSRKHAYTYSFPFSRSW